LVSKPFGVKTLNELLATSNKLTKNVARQVTSTLGPDVASGPLVLHAGVTHFFVPFHIFNNTKQQ
jgi:hypothetical protein